MKLFEVYIVYETIDSVEECSNLFVAESKEESEQKAVKNFDYNVLSCYACEINEVDGYKIKLEKERKK